MNNDSPLTSQVYVGALFGITASFCVAVNAIYTKKSLVHLNDDTWRLTLYTNVNTTLIMIPFMFALGEFDIISNNIELVSSANFWIMNSIAGLFGVFIGLATMLQIKYTSPLTHNVSGTAKACAQTVFALTIWQKQSKSSLWWFSNFLVLLGSFGYAYVKQEEMREASDAHKEKAELKREVV